MHCAVTTGWLSSFRPPCCLDSEIRQGGVFFQHHVEYRRAAASTDNTRIRHIGRIFICCNYLARNRETISFAPEDGNEASCVTMAGDYVFTGGWMGQGKCRSIAYPTTRR